jgi:hypothetical protein
MKEYVPMDHPIPMMNSDENYRDAERLELASMAPKENMVLLNESFSFANSNSQNYA